MEDILFKITELKKSGKKAALCIIVETTGSSPRKAGSKMLVLEDGSIYGSIGGGTLEYKVIEDAQKILLENTPGKFVYELEEDLSMHCGGSAEIYIEPIIPSLRLFIFGAGHIGKALAKYAPEFGFSVILIDPRKEIIEQSDPKCVELICEDFAIAVNKLNFDRHSFIVILTPKHAYDEEVLALCAKREFAYLGMIGSKTKVALARKRLIEEKILNQRELDKVDMPIGIKFNAQTPEEIAISILAKLIDVKNSGNEK